MKISKIIDTLEKTAPLDYAEEWDNSGLICGSTETKTNNVVICLDVTEKALKKCIENDAKLCICHHPYIFKPVSKIDYNDPFFKILSEFIKNDITIYAAHTNLDSCYYGVSDALCDKLEIMAEFTFMPFEKDEVSSDVITPGLGRVGKWNHQGGLIEFLKFVSEKLNTSGCHINFDENREINKILAVGGSFDSAWNQNVVEAGIDLVLSGEIKHSDMMFFRRNNIAAIAAGHDATERVILIPLAEMLEKQLPSIKFDVLTDLDYNKVVF